MRILWVKAGRLLPVDTGGKIRSYNIVRQLSTRHDVTVLTYYDGPKDREYEQAMAEQFRSAVTIHTGSAASTLGTAARYLRYVPSKAPFAVTKFTAPAVRRSIEQRLAGGEVDVAVCDFLSASLNFPVRPPVPCVLFQHNVESVLWQRQAREERQPVRRAVFRLESAKMSRYEAAAVRRFDHVIAVSDADRDAMRDMVPFDRMSVVPTGVDTLKYRPAGCAPQDGLVLFLGSMDWEPNVDGVEFFCREVWPHVMAAVPHARFRVVGRNPLPSIRRLASSSVEITGTVPSVLEHLHQAAVVVVPLRIGGGTRLKIYESMAAAKAVVSTTIGAEGLDVHDGRDIVLADTAGAFAAAVVRVLKDAAERRRIETAAIELARRYDWREVSVTFEQVLAAVLGRRAADSAPDPLEATA